MMSDPQEAVMSDVLWEEPVFAVADDASGLAAVLALHDRCAECQESIAGGAGYSVGTSGSGSARIRLHEECLRSYAAHQKDPRLRDFCTQLAAAHDQKRASTGERS